MVVTRGTFRTPLRGLNLPIPASAIFFLTLSGHLRLELFTIAAQL